MAHCSDMLLHGGRPLPGWTTRPRPSSRVPAKQIDGNMAHLMVSQIDNTRTLRRIVATNFNEEDPDSVFPFHHVSPREHVYRPATSLAPGMLVLNQCAGRASSKAPMKHEHSNGDGFLRSAKY